ncbi:MAG: hypothetical protein WEA11_05530 [Acidimicrobiales bacterium]
MAVPKFGGGVGAPLQASATGGNGAGGTAAVSTGQLGDTGADCHPSAGAEETGG